MGLGAMAPSQRLTVHQLEDFKKNEKWNYNFISVYLDQNYKFLLLKESLGNHFFLFKKYNESMKA